MYLKYISILFSITAISACQNPQSIDNLESIIENDHTIININASWFNPKAKYDQFKAEYIPLETNSNSLIGYIDDIKFDENLYFILDKNIAKGIFIFNEDGEFLNAIKTTGRGPKEIFRINDFTIDTKRNRILISDLTLRKIIEFDYEGKYLAEHKNKLWFSNIEFISEDLYLYYLSHYGLSENENESVDRGPLVSLGNIEGELIKSLIEIPNRPSLSTIVENFHAIQSSPLHFTKVLDPTIYQLDTSSRLLKKLYSFDFHELNIPNHYLSIKTNNFRVFARDTEFSQLKSFSMNSDHMIVTVENPKQIPGQKILISTIIDRQKPSEVEYYLPTNLPDQQGVMIPTLKYSYNEYFYGSFYADDIISANKQANNVIKENHPALKLLEEDDNPVIIKVQISN